MSSVTTQFHLAFPVRDLEEARAFYVETIGCKPGRETSNHIDLDMFGHHVVAHLIPDAARAAPSEFDGHEVPVPHFGLNLARADWAQLAERLKRSRCRFREYPHARLVGQVGEHDTLFVYDPSGNALEFKSFHNPSHVFAIDPLHHGAGPAPDSEQVLRPRVEAALHRVRGGVQEDLLVSGFLDSIGAMELVTAIQQDLGTALSDLQMTDLATMTTLVAAVAGAVRGRASSAAGAGAR
ncbi:MAG TPA: VOC family protein [Kofleriaceae bacterium]|nr:VOC family protein [Kofleriaceae bacterium]